MASEDRKILHGLMGRGGIRCRMCCNRPSPQNLADKALTRQAKKIARRIWKKRIKREIEEGGHDERF